MVITVNAYDECCTHQLGSGRSAQPDRSLRKDNHRISNPNVAGLSATETCRSNIRQQHYLLIGQLIRNFGEIRLGVWYQQVFGLRAIDGVAEAPAADGFIAFTVSTLRKMARQ